MRIRTAADLGAFIRERRTKLGMDQIALAKKAGTSRVEPKYEDFQPRTIWSLSNAFTSAFKELDPIPQFRATAKLGEFLDARFSQSF